MEKMDVSDPGLWSPQGYSHPPRWPFGTMDDFPEFWRCPCLRLTRHRDFLAACCNRKRCWMERHDSLRRFSQKDSLILDQRLWKHGNKWLFTVRFCLDFIVIFWNTLQKKQNKKEYLHELKWFQILCSLKWFISLVGAGQSFLSVRKQELMELMEASSYKYHPQLTAVYHSSRFQDGML